MKEPKKFRENVRQLIIWMNDQIPMWLKIKPGKQIFAEYEVRQRKYIGKEEIAFSRMNRHAA